MSQPESRSQQRGRRKREGKSNWFQRTGVFHLDSDSNHTWLLQRQPVWSRYSHPKNMKKPNFWMRITSKDGLSDAGGIVFSRESLRIRVLSTVYWGSRLSVSQGSQSFRDAKGMLNPKTFIQPVFFHVWSRNHAFRVFKDLSQRTYEKPMSDL